MYIVPIQAINTTSVTSQKCILSWHQHIQQFVMHTQKPEELKGPTYISNKKILNAHPFYSICNIKKQLTVKSSDISTKFRITSECCIWNTHNSLYFSVFVFVWHIPHPIITLSTDLKNEWLRLCTFVHVCMQCMYYNVMWCNFK